MKMENLLIYYVASYATLLSAFLGFIFSVMVIRSSDCTSKTTAFYLLARSTVLALASLIPVLLYSLHVLSALTVIMLVVQVIDVGIGILIKNIRRTVGPFIMAAVHLTCLLLLNSVQV